MLWPNRSGFNSLVPIIDQITNPQRLEVVRPSI